MNFTVKTELNNPLASLFTRSQFNWEYLGFHVKLLEGKRFATMNQLKNKLYDILKNDDENMVKRYVIGIYSRIEVCIKSNRCLTN